MVQVSASPRPPPADPRLRRFRSGVAVAIIVQLVLVIVGVGLAGGFRTAPPRPLPRAAVGEPVDNGRFEIKVLRAWTVGKDPFANPEYATAGRFLVLELELRLTVKESLQFDADIQGCLLLTLPNGFKIDGDKSNSLQIRTGAMLASDGSDASLHPGLPQRVQAVYELPAKLPLPTHLDVVVYRMEFTPGFFDRTRIWRLAADHREVAEIRLPVTRSAP